MISKVNIHPEGPVFSKLIFGTWRLLDTPDASKKTPEAILARIKECLKLGITTFDLADIYGGGHHQVEKAFGQALALEPKLREQMQLVTKCGIRCDGVGEGLVPVKHYDTSKPYVLERVNESLHACGVSYFDLVLIHRPDPFMNAEDTADAFKQLHAEGKVKYFGVSNFLPQHVELLQSRIPFKLVNNQIEMSVMHLNPLYDGTLDQCQKLRIAPMIWSPLAGGRIFQKDATDARVVRVQKALDKVGAELGVQRDQAAFAWLLAHPANLLPILGTSDIARIQGAAKAAQLKMSKLQWYEILEASNGCCVP
jgi:predicted oxidoreductase